MGNRINKALSKSWEEIEHLFPNTYFEDYRKNAIRIKSDTNINFAYKNYFIRVPYKELSVFFNRQAEYNNIQLVNSQLELTPLPVYYNIQTGLMVNIRTSPEIYLDEKFIDTESFNNCVKNLNTLNGSGLDGANAFNYEIAFAYFRTQNHILDEYIMWAEKFYNSFFATVDKNRLEFSHNDPDFRNFTITNNIIDFEYSGMSPVLSDLSNMISMYYSSSIVKKYLVNIKAPNKEMEPLTIFWLLFWGMWGLSKDQETISDKNYFIRAGKLFDRGITRLDRFRQNL